MIKKVVQKFGCLKNYYYLSYKKNNIQKKREPFSPPKQQQLYKI